MYKISDEVIKFIEKTMKTWKVELTAGGRSLAEAKIQRGIFQGDAISPFTIHNCDDATYSENAQPDTNLVNRK